MYVCWTTVIIYIHGVHYIRDLSYPPLDAMLSRYQVCPPSPLLTKPSIMVVVPQDPKEADPMMRVQNDLDETKIVLVSISFMLRQLE